MAAHQCEDSSSSRAYSPEEVLSELIQLAKIQLPTGQEWLFKLIDSAGYHIETRGVCYGIAHMAAQAFLAGDLLTFCRRFSERFDTPRARRRYKNFLKLFSINKRTMRSPRVDIDVLAFFDGVVAYQSPMSHRELYGGRFYTQIQTPALDVVHPAELSEAGENMAHVFTQTGVYTEDDLAMYLMSLQKTITAPYSLVLMAEDHAVNLNYDPMFRRWLIIDVEHLPIIIHADIEKTVDELFRCFACKNSKPGKFLMTSRIYTLRKYKSELNDCLKKIKELPDFKRIHLAEEDALTVVHGEWQKTWLDVAVIYNDVTSVNTWLAAGFKLNQKNSKGETPFFLSCKLGNLEIARAFLTLGDVDVNQTSEDGFTPLFAACHNGFSEIVQELLKDNDIDISYSSKDGITPLEIALESEFFEIADILQGYSVSSLKRI